MNRRAHSLGSRGLRQDGNEQLGCGSHDKPGLHEYSSDPFPDVAKSPTTANELPDLVLVIACSFKQSPGVVAKANQRCSEESGLDIVTLLRGSTSSAKSSEAEATSRMAWHQSNGKCSVSYISTLKAARVVIRFPLHLLS